MTAIQSQTLRILRSFDEREWQDLKNYFDSPFFYNPQSRDPILPNLVKVLCDYFQLNKIQEDGEFENPSHAYLWEKLYRNKETNKTRINNLLSSLEGHLTHFFAHLELQDDSSELKDVMALQYLNREKDKSLAIRKYFASRVNKTEKKFKRNKEERPDNWYQKYLLEKVKSSFFKMETKFKREKYLKDLVKNLDFFHLTEKLKYLCVLVDRSIYVESSVSDLYIEDFKAYLEEMKPIVGKSSPIFKLYYYLFIALTDENQAYYYELLEKEYFSNGLKITNHERNDIRESLVNYYIRQANLDKEGYLETLFQFYKEGLGLERNLILSNGKLTYGNYRNIVVVAVKTGNWQWAKDFTDTYKKNIEPDFHAESVYSYCQAFLCIQSEIPDYETALSHLENMDSKYIFIDVWRRTLSIKCYYELGDSYAKLLEASLDSFIVYLRQKPNKKRLLLYKNFVLLLGRIVRLHVPDKSHKKYISLKKKIQEEEHLVQREWLLEKLAEKVK